MAETAADVLIENILDWGVDTVFGLPGDGINGIMEALRTEEIRPTLERAISSNKPSLVEVVVDPFEPPMPPKVTIKQALHFAEALAKGQPHGGRIALTLFRDKLNELL